ncbi:hypothetical protein WJX81_007177 [Elliptochloris bilobata]|uniref:Septin-type G domain-containing protein n=1 Tax=Elliptochloris bilobata TaxID=381761 RepID=A0AAW1S978_9CHLO
MSGNLPNLPSSPGSLPDCRLLRQDSQVSQQTSVAGSQSHGPSGFPHAAELLGTIRPSPTKMWKHRYFKILIVGDSGLGKTTLVRALLSVPGQRLELHDGTETSAEQFRKNPEALCSSISWESESDRTVWVYKVQDTPGYGDNCSIMSNIAEMVAYVERQNMMYLRAEQDTRRAVDLADVEDPRVDLCIFCLPPHRLRPIDLRYMHELGRVCAIVPVICKADSMTMAEQACFRQEVVSRLGNPSLAGYTALAGVTAPINVLQFSEATRMRAGLGASPGKRIMPPFLVVAANEFSGEMAAADPPVYWPERKYTYGTAEAFNTEHSDLMFLRKLLLDACEEVGAAKRLRYQEWRRRRLEQRGSLRGLLSRAALLGVACAVAAAFAGMTPSEALSSLRGLPSVLRQEEDVSHVFQQRRRRRSEISDADLRAEIPSEVQDVPTSEPAQSQPQTKLFGLF